MEKVFYNLLDNATRYGGKITKVRFTDRLQDDQLVIGCEDDGVGIPAYEKESIFDRGHGKNTGLGLTLSQQILATTGNHQGVRGARGRGEVRDIRASGKVPPITAFQGKIMAPTHYYFT